MVDYKKLFEDLLTARCTGDTVACTVCQHDIKCRGKKCPEFICGDKGYLDGKPVDFKWTCMDFTFGECPLLENTPCFHCIENDYSGFCLDEKKLSKLYKKRKNKEV